MAGQNVDTSLVIGDVVQVAGVTGNVTINTSRSPYRIDALPLAPAELTPERARAQPSRLLQPRYQVVPFAGRDEELADLAAWMDPSARSMRVRLVCAAGGQGKTRLAGHVAGLCGRSGWAVWRANQLSGAAMGGVTELTASGGGALVVVDYADRWPVSALLDLLTALYRAQLTGLTLRILLLARSASYWWDTLAGVLDDLDLVADARLLARLGDTQLDRATLFRVAARCFADAMNLPAETAEVPVPAELSGDGYAQVLAVHMAALVAVDTRHAGGTAPIDPHAVSAYLLRREYRHWQTLHSRSEGPLRTTPPMMRRTAYVASLIGALPRADARAALCQVELAADAPSADQLIDDYLFCHPVDLHDAPQGPLVLEPLRPDRLGEDFIALITPGHPHANPGSWQPDDWTNLGLSALLAVDNPVPVWAPSAITVLVETAHRWPHVAERVLYPLLRLHPELAVAAGGSTLIRLTELPGVDMATLDAVEKQLSNEPHIDLDAAGAAITTILIPHQLTQTSEPARLAWLHAKHAYRLANAGRHVEALDPAREAVTIRRQLAELDPANLPDLAHALKRLAVCLSEVGRRNEALDPVEEAVTLFRQLAEHDPDTYLPDLATSLSDRGCHLSVADCHTEALDPTQEAVSIRRQLAKHNPDTYLPHLADSLTNLANHLDGVGRSAEALDPSQEAVTLFRQLAKHDPDTYLPRLAAALNNLGSHLGGVGRHVEALDPAREAVTIRRQLA